MAHSPGVCLTAFWKTTASSSRASLELRPVPLTRLSWLQVSRAADGLAAVEVGHRHVRIGGEAELRVTLAARRPEGIDPTAVLAELDGK